jgi:hypothetical protein
MTRAAAFLLALFLASAAHAQDAIVIGASVDRLDDGNGGSAPVLWIHLRGENTLTAGGAFFSLADARWAYATLGAMRCFNERTIVNAEANLGRGDDDGGDFRHLLLRTGVTRELLPKRLYGEGEWLQADVAQRQNGIARIGATYLPQPPLTLRGSLYQSVAGDDDTTLVTLRGDYDLGGMIAIGGFSAGRATPVLLSATGYTAGDELLRDAYLAVHRARQQGAASHVLFDPKMHAIRLFLSTGRLRSVASVSISHTFVSNWPTEAGARLPPWQEWSRMRHRVRGTRTPTPTTPSGWPECAPATAASTTRSFRAVAF